MSLFKKNTNKVVIERIIGAPKSQNQVEKEQAPSIPDGMWKKCNKCNQAIYNEDLQETLNVCPSCGNHFRLTAPQRIMFTADEGTFEEFSRNIRCVNPLNFPGYEDKLKSARAFTSMLDAIVTGTCEIAGNKCVIAAMDSQFMMGSMGSAVGEKMVIAVEKAIELNLPLVVFTVSGGARMQEGIISLMQMAKVSGSINKLAQAGLLYLVVLTDPTTGGVTASFAMEGDITLCEPDALVGFAGQRVIEQTINQALPAGFQRAEFLKEKGFVDAIVHRKELANTIGKILSMHQGAENAGK